MINQQRTAPHYFALNCRYSIYGDLNSFLEGPLYQRVSGGDAAEALREARGKQRGIDQAGIRRRRYRTPFETDQSTHPKEHLMNLAQTDRRKAPADPRASRDPVISEHAGGTVDVVTDVRRAAALLKTGALQDAIFNSANFSSIATDDKGVIQLFNVGAERMLGYTALEVVDKITPADISDPLEVIARAKALSLELATPITPGFEALVFT